MNERQPTLSEDKIKLYLNRARKYMKNRRFAQAERLLRRATKLLKSSGQGNTLQLADVLEMHAEVLSVPDRHPRGNRNHRLVAAHRYAEQALAIRIRLLGAYSMEVAEKHQLISYRYSHSGNYTQAVAHLERWWTILTKNKTHVITLNDIHGFSHIAAAYMGLNDGYSAERVLKHYLKLLKKFHGCADTWDASHAYEWLSQIYKERSEQLAKLSAPLVHFRFRSGVSVLRQEQFLSRIRLCSGVIECERQTASESNGKHGHLWAYALCRVDASLPKFVALLKRTAEIASAYAPKLSR